MPHPLLPSCISCAVCFRPSCIHSYRVTYYVEFLPRKTRGLCITLLELWWAVGSIFAALLAWAIIPTGQGIQQLWYRHIIIHPCVLLMCAAVSDDYDWRVYLGLCAFPLAIVLLLFPVSVSRNHVIALSTGFHDNSLCPSRRAITSLEARVTKR